MLGPVNIANQPFFFSPPQVPAAVVTVASELAGAHAVTSGEFSPESSRSPQLSRRHSWRPASNLHCSLGIPVQQRRDPLLGFVDRPRNKRQDQAALSLLLTVGLQQLIIDRPQLRSRTRTDAAVQPAPSFREHLHHRRVCCHQRKQRWRRQLLLVPGRTARTA